MPDEPRNCLSYLKRFWRPLLARWIVIAVVMAIASPFLGLSLAESWPLILIASATLNYLWTWVA